MTSAITSPSSSLDLFNDVVLTDPYPWYATLRNMGPAVYLQQHDVWALPRYKEVRAALTDADRFSSVGGVALTEEVNTTILAGTVLAADGEDHKRLRRPLGKALGPHAVKALTRTVYERADRIVASLVRRETFDAATDLAQQFVADVVMDLMGLPPEVRDWLITAAAATFDMFGPANDRYTASTPTAGAMIQFLTEVATRDAVQPDSWLGKLYQAADAGFIGEEEVIPLMTAYTTAGMDTTIHGISTAIELLCRHPQQFAALRNGRVTPDAVAAEALRFDAPLQAFGRRVTADTRIGDARIDAGERVWLLWGSTGRDQHMWGPTADIFDPHRPDTDQHLALGAGAHVCAGKHLAELESRAVLHSLASRCTSISLTGAPIRALNNVLRGWEHLPIKVVPDRRRSGSSS